MSPKECWIFNAMPDFDVNTIEPCSAFFAELSWQSLLIKSRHSQEICDISEKGCNFETLASFDKPSFWTGSEDDSKSN